MSNIGNEYIRYGLYNAHPVNKLLHIVCIPIIIQSIFILTYPYSIVYCFNLGMIVLLTLPLYYICFNCKMGLVTTIFFVIMYIVSWGFKDIEVRGKHSLLKLDMLILITISIHRGKSLTHSLSLEHWWSAS